MSAPARATALLLGGVALGGLAGASAAFGPRPTRVGGAVLFGLGSALLLTMGGFAVSSLAKHPVAKEPGAPSAA
ncbi:MAG: hypothetical protein U0228_27445 [Myxococcaceae bacterium]